MDFPYDTMASSSADVRIVAFDTETTGLSFERDYPVSVGFVLMDMDGEIKDEKQFYVKYRDPVDLKDSTRVHGITQDQLEHDGVGFLEVVHALHDTMLNTNVLVAHNFEFDAKMMLQGFRRLEAEGTPLTERAEKVKRYFGHIQCRSTAVPSVRLSSLVRDEFLDFPVPCCTMLSNRSRAGRYQKLKTLATVYKVDTETVDGSFHGALFDATIAGKVFVQSLWKKLEEARDDAETAP